MCICENVVWNVIKKNSVCFVSYLFLFRSFIFVLRIHTTAILQMSEAKESKLFARRIDMRVGVNSILTCAHILNNTFFFGWIFSFIFRGCCRSSSVLSCYRTNGWFFFLQLFDSAEEVVLFCTQFQPFDKCYAKQRLLKSVWWADYKQIIGKCWKCIHLNKFDSQVSLSTQQQPPANEQTTTNSE